MNQHQPIQHRVSMDAAMATVILILGIALVWIGSSAASRGAVQDLMAGHPDFEGLLGLLATVTGLAVVLWWILSLLAALIAAVLGKLGKNRASEQAGRFAPVFMRRLALAILGINLLAAPMAQATDAALDPRWHPVPAVSATAGAAATVTANANAANATATSSPAATATAIPSSTTATPPSAAPAHPPLSAATSQAVSGSTPIRGAWTPSAPAANAGVLAPPQKREVAESASPTSSASAASNAKGGRRAGTVAAVAGDSLWSLAARHLPAGASDAEIAAEWPRWFQLNREVVGEDPNLLLPGTVLWIPAH
ncbi:LysM peptidoglycan-binding domain-containing protein [Pseudarthrobacter sp. J1738]|uniref:LysM peptidoglycan-binding domain-containing protein n=1 Tax=Pseudarthrobacter sp. J1738 TaxID=3420446 RepID=UPI003D2DD744